MLRVVLTTLLRLPFWLPLYTPLMDPHSDDSLAAPAVKQAGSWFTLELGSFVTLAEAAEAAEASAGGEVTQDGEQAGAVPLKFQGMEKLRAAVESDPALFARLEGLVADYNSGVVVEAVDPQPDEALLQSP